MPLSTHRWVVRRWDSSSCDLLDPDAVRAAFAGRPGGDRYVFCAAKVPSRGDSADAGADNQRMLDHLLHALAGSCAHFVFLSSVDVYGPPLDGAVLDESSPLAPDGPYAESKVWSEKRLRAVDIRFPVTTFRLPGVYGPSDGLRSTAGLLARKILEGDTITLPPQTVLRDFVTAADVAALTESALATGTVGTYVAASGYSLSLRRIVALLERGLELPASVATRTEPSQRDADLRFDTRRLHEAFGDVEMTPMTTGLVRYGEWVRHGMNQ
ncbi:MAG: NAD(P)-dependent oxidoreductase [Thermoanaerobaculia bacterium]|nr:NAD(P)-dependent oxidoreductase [Thermoanaerobaculia bacterium]